MIFVAILIGLYLLLLGVAAFCSQAILGWCLRNLQSRSSEGYSFLWNLSLIATAGGGFYVAWMVTANRIRISGGASGPGGGGEIFASLFLVWPFFVSIVGLWFGALWALLRTPAEFARRIAHSPSQLRSLLTYSAIITAIVAGISGWLYYVFRDI